MVTKSPKKATGHEAKLAAQVLQLTKQVEELERKVKKQDVGQKGPEMRFPKLPAWVMLREYLMSVGGTDVDVNITRALLQAGHDLGKYPLRTVMNTAKSPRLKGMFTVDRGEDGKNFITVSPSYFYRPPIQNRRTFGGPALVKSSSQSKK